MLATMFEAQRERWDTETELLAALVEAVDFGNRMFHAAWIEGDVPEPVEIHRPGDNADEDRLATPAEMKAFFGGAVQYTS